MKITALWDKLRRVDDLDPFGRAIVRDGEDFLADRVRAANRQTFRDVPGSVRYYWPGDERPKWANVPELPPEAFSPDEPQVTRFVMKANRNDKGPGA